MYCVAGLKLCDDCRRRRWILYACRNLLNETKAGHFISHYEKKKTVMYKKACKTKAGHMFAISLNCTKYCLQERMKSTLVPSNRIEVRTTASAISSTHTTPSASEQRILNFSWSRNRRQDRASLEQSCLSLFYCKFSSLIIQLQVSTRFNHEFSSSTRKPPGSWPDGRCLPAPDLLFCY